MEEIVHQEKKMRPTLNSHVLVLALAVLSSANGIAGGGSQAPILPQLPTSPLVVANTVPSNGDVNPYGVAVVPVGFPEGGPASSGDILVSNFNNSGNLQGTGTTIVSISPSGTTRPFFQGSPGLGLTTALAVLKEGVVIVGNVPTTDGTCSTIQQGSLLVLSKNGQILDTLANRSLLNGPWDLTVNDTGVLTQVFVSNVLSGTITRLDFAIAPDGTHLATANAVQIASGYSHRCDPNALVVGPTGLAFDPTRHLLYVASTDDNAIYSIPNADAAPSDHGKGALVYSDNAHLRGPVGLVLAPNGNLIATNGDAVNGDPAFPSEMIEFTPAGQFIAQLSVDLGGQGGAFGLVFDSVGNALRFAAVDDVNNTLKIWTLQ
jgi:hypothetical protein